MRRTYRCASPASSSSAHAAYLPLRIAGVVLLVIGLVLVTLGNFVD